MGPVALSGQLIVMVKLPGASQHLFARLQKSVPQAFDQGVSLEFAAPAARKRSSYRSTAIIRSIGGHEVVRALSPHIGNQLGG